MKKLNRQMLHLANLDSLQGGHLLQFSQSIRETKSRLGGYTAWAYLSYYINRLFEAKALAYTLLRHSTGIGLLCPVPVVVFPHYH